MKDKKETEAFYARQSIILQNFRDQKEFEKIYDPQMKVDIRLTPDWLLIAVVAILTVVTIWTENTVWGVVTILVAAYLFWQIGIRAGLKAGYRSGYDKGFVDGFMKGGENQGKQK